MIGGPNVEDGKKDKDNSEPAPEGRQHIARGASPGWEIRQTKAPEGRQKGEIIEGFQQCTKR